MGAEEITSAYINQRAKFMIYQTEKKPDKQKKTASTAKTNQLWIGRLAKTSPGYMWK